MGGVGGWEKLTFCTFSEDGQLKRLNIRLGQETIYPAHQLAYPEEFPDDVHNTGETLQEALRRERKHSDKYVIIHAEGIIRNQGIRRINLSIIAMLEKEAVKEINDLARSLWHKRGKPKDEDKIDWAAAEKQLHIPNQTHVGNKWCPEIGEDVVPALS
jgi:hypothetical protein